MLAAHEPVLQHTCHWCITFLKTNYSHAHPFFHPSRFQLVIICGWVDFFFFFWRVIPPVKQNNSAISLFIFQPSFPHFLFCTFTRTLGSNHTAPHEHSHMFHHSAQPFAFWTVGKSELSTMISALQRRILHLAHSLLLTTSWVSWLWRY